MKGAQKSLFKLKMLENKTLNEMKLRESVEVLDIENIKALQMR